MKKHLLSKYLSVKNLSGCFQKSGPCVGLGVASRNLKPTRYYKAVACRSDPMSSPHSKASLIPAALGSRAGLAGMGAALGTRRRRARRKCARFCVTSHAEQLRALALVDGPAS